jgi:hypothetical protein
MRIKRAIVPVILALCTAGSILAGSAVPMVAAQAASPSATPNVYYHG